MQASCFWELYELGEAPAGDTAVLAVRDRFVRQYSQEPVQNVQGSPTAHASEIFSAVGREEFSSALENRDEEDSIAHVRECVSFLDSIPLDADDDEDDVDPADIDENLYPDN